LQVESWTLDDYKAAMQNASFAEDVEPSLSGLCGDEDEKLESKFYLAGHSARWMFALTVSEVLNSVCEHISRLADLKHVMKAVGTKHKHHAVNHLLFDDGTKLVSQYVTRLIAEKYSLQFVSQARKSALASNPSFDGWIFEADFLIHVKLAEESHVPLSMCDEQGNGVFWNVAKIDSFDTIESWSPTELKNDSWIIPQRWNQGCYDAVHYVGDGVVRFIQVTRAHHHSLKLKHPVLFLKKLVESTNILITTVEMVFILDKEAMFVEGFVKFKVDAPIGQWEDFASAVREDCLCYGFART